MEVLTYEGLNIMKVREILFNCALCIVFTLLTLICNVQVHEGDICDVRVPVAPQHQPAPPVLPHSEVRAEQRTGEGAPAALTVPVQYSTVQYSAEIPIKAL